MATKKQIKGGRALLNMPGFHSTAAIVAEMSPGEVYPNVQISDCTRQINLEFDVTDADNYENSLHKIDALLSNLGKCKRALVAEGKSKGYDS